MILFYSPRALPDSVVDNLPDQAQEIYLTAFLDACKTNQLKDDADESQKQLAHRIAWDALKQDYINKRTCE